DIILSPDIPGQTTILQGDAIGIVKIDGLGPLVVDNVRDHNSLVYQLLTLGLQGCYRAGLKGKMIKRAGDTQPFVNGRVIVRWNPLNSLWLHKGDELIAARVEKHVPNLAPFRNLDDVAAHGLESQDVLVEVPRAVEVPCRESDV